MSRIDRRWRSRDWHELIGDTRFRGEDAAAKLVLAPYQVLWLVTDAPAAAGDPPGLKSETATRRTDSPDEPDPA
jgi:hypothetical protein